MRKHLPFSVRCRLLQLLFALLFVGGRAQAGAIVSAELMYRWLGGNTYELILKTSVGCKDVGQPEPDSIKGFYYSDCGNSPTRIYYQKMSGALPTAIGGKGNNGDQTIATLRCDSFPGNKNIPPACADPASAIDSRYQFWYSTIITLPAACSLWHFTAVADRDGGENKLSIYNNSYDSWFTYSSNPQFFIEATLNNAVAVGSNNSVFMTGGDVIPFSAKGGMSNPNLFSYALGAVRPGGRFPCL